MSGTMSQINDPMSAEGASVVDPHHSGSAVPEIRDAHFCSEWQGAMSSCHGAWPEHLATGGAIAKKARPIPAGFPCGNMQKNWHWRGS